jgi:hypothetical protein
MGSERSRRAGLAACRLRAALEISLANDELYAVAAYILQLNCIIDDSDVMRAAIANGGDAEPRRLRTILRSEKKLPAPAPLVRNAG